jgi:hypothetical protein
LFFLVQPEKDGTGAGAIHAFTVSATVIAVMLAGTAVLAFFIPRNLKIRGRAAS